MELIFCVCMRYKVCLYLFCSVNQHPSRSLLENKTEQNKKTFPSLLCTITFENLNYFICVDLFWVFLIQPICLLSSLVRIAHRLNNLITITLEYILLHYTVLLKTRTSMTRSHSSHLVGCRMWNGYQRRTRGS